MAILIKGMKMPKPKFADITTVYNAYVLVHPNGHAVIVVENEDGLDSTEYPLTPVPPHGDLIDRDELIENGELVNENTGFYSLQGISMESINIARTIIKAEQ